MEAFWVWRSALAWQVAGFMGLQSMMYYVVVGWFPSVMQDIGFTSIAAGWLMSVFQVVSQVSCLRCQR